MKEKMLRITMPDGSVWDVPAMLIAANRTNYYAEKDGFKPGSKEYVEEFDFSMTKSELIDWSANNMNWSDVSASAKMVKNGEVDYQEGWVNGDKEVV